MNRMFDLKMIIKAALIVTLSLAIVFASGCRKKQPDKSAKTPQTHASNNQKTPRRDASPQTQTPAVEAADQNIQNVEANDPNVATLSEAAQKETTAVPDTNTKETTAAAPQTETQTAISAPQESAITEQPSSAPPEEMTSSEPLDLNSFGAMSNTSKKFDFISKFAGKSPELLPALVDKALDDEDPGIRGAAMEELLKKGFYNPSDILPVVEKAMGDADPTIRQQAIDACAHINDPAVGDIIKLGLGDENEKVRVAAIQLAAQKDPAIRLPILEAGMASQYADVKAGAATELMNTPRKDAISILITGLKDTDPDFRYTIQSILNSRIGQEFESYDQAVQWWNANRDNFTDDLKPQNVPPESPNSPPKL